MAAMAARLIDGKAFAAGVRARVGERVAALKAEQGVTPGLAVILVGADPASQVYVGSKEKMAVEAGMHSVVHRMGPEASEAELLAKVAELNADPAIHGILVQLPLPSHIAEDKVILAIDPAKDVDGFHPTSVGRLSIGQPGMVPCTPKGCMMLIRDVLGERGFGHWAVQYCGQAHGTAAAGGELHGDPGPFADPGSGRPVSPHGYCGRRSGAAGDGQRRLVEARSLGH
jgi:hypothetical protein